MPLLSYYTDLVALEEVRKKTSSAAKKATLAAVRATPTRTARAAPEADREPFLYPLRAMRAGATVEKAHLSGGTGDGEEEPISLSTTKSAVEAVRTHRHSEDSSRVNSLDVGGSILLIGGGLDLDLKVRSSQKSPFVALRSLLFLLCN